MGIADDRSSWRRPTVEDPPHNSSSSNNPDNKPNRAPDIFKNIRRTLNNNRALTLIVSHAFVIFLSFLFFSNPAPNQKNQQISELNAAPESRREDMTNAGDAFNKSHNQNTQRSYAQETNRRLENQKISELSAELQSLREDMERAGNSSDKSLHQNTQKPPSKKTNSYLENQRISELNAELESCRNKLNKKNMGGTGFGSCWINENGKTEDIISMAMYDNGFTIMETWPPSRNDEAKRIGLIKSKIKNRFIENTEFEIILSRVLRHSAKMTPSCRFLGTYIDKTSSKAIFKRQQNFINSYLVGREK